jgi:hypothetical protein
MNGINEIIVFLGYNGAGYPKNKMFLFDQNSVAKFPRGRRRGHIFPIASQVIRFYHHVRVWYPDGNNTQRSGYIIQADVYGEFEDGKAPGRRRIDAGSTLPVPTATV